MPSYTYRVAPSGQTAGVVVVPWRGKKLTITVLPKFWGARFTGVLDLDTVATERITVRESGTLVARGSAVSLAAFDALLATTHEIASDSDPIAAHRGLFVLARVDDALEPGAPVAMDPDANAFWNLAFEFMQDGVFVREPLRAMYGTQEVAAYLSESGLAELPELTPVLRRLFLSECVSTLRHRPSQATTEVEALASPRGRVHLKDLPNRMRRVNASILCERSSIDQDDAWSRVIRCALRSIATDECAAWQERAQASALERLLPDVTLVRATHACAAITGKPVPRKYVRLAQLSRIGETVLRQSPHFGAGVGKVRQGVVTTLLVDTSRLFECVLRDAASELGMSVAEKPYFGIWKGYPAAKRPDLAIQDGSIGSLIIDAKYKSIDSMMSMQMSDQYQQFAYASVSEVPTVFAYARSGSTLRGETWSDFVESDTDAAVVLGCVIVPFPKAGAVADGTWRSDVSGALAGALNALRAFENQRSER